VRRKWRKIQGAHFNQLAVPLARKKVIKGNLKQLLNQAAGVVVSIAAYGNYDDLNATLQSVGERVDERLTRKNAAFDGEKENRRNRFLR